MSKQHIIDRLRDTRDLTTADATRQVDDVFRALGAAMMDRETVRIRGFGTFKVVDRKATTRRNPRTGEPVETPAKSVVKFTPEKRREPRD